MMAYHATASEAPFTGDLLVTLPTEDGRITLSGNSLRRTTRTDTRRKQVASEELTSVLRDQFGLVEYGD